MRRRDFVLGLLTAAAGVGLGASLPVRAARSDLPALGASDFCGQPIAMSMNARTAALPEQLTIAGSRLLKQGLLEQLGAAYRASTGREAIIHGGGCDDGLLATRLKQAHCGSLCCPVPGSPAEGMYWLPAGKDVKVVLTHASNPISDITFDELRAIAAGRIHNWRSVGGEDSRIALVVHEHCPTYFEPVRELLRPGRTSWTSRRLRTRTDEDHLRQIRRFRSAIGVNSWILAAPYVERGELKTLRVNGVAPTVEEASRGTYPLVGPLNLIFSEWSDELMRPFFQFLYEQSGTQFGIVDVALEEALAAGYIPRKARHGLATRAAV